MESRTSARRPGRGSPSKARPYAKGSRRYSRRTAAGREWWTAESRVRCRRMRIEPNWAGTRTPTDQRLGVPIPSHTQDHRALDLHKQGSGAVTVPSLVVAWVPVRRASPPVLARANGSGRVRGRRVRHLPRTAGPAGTGLRRRRRSAGSPCCSFAWWRQQICDHGDRGRHEAVVRPDTALVALKQSGLGQDSEVMTHGRLGEPKGCGEVRYGRLSLRSRLDKAEQP